MLRLFGAAAAEFLPMTATAGIGIQIPDSIKNSVTVNIMNPQFQTPVCSNSQLMLHNILTI